MSRRAVEQVPLPEVDPAIAEAARDAKLIGAPTTSAADHWSWARRPAVALARELGARVVLADVSTRSLLSTPYGRGGVGADRRAPYTDGTTAVSRSELALLGHDELIDQLDEAAAVGVEADGWLADRPGVLALDRFLELFPLDVLVIPTLEDPTFVDVLRGDHLAAVRRRMEHRLLLLAGEDGSLQVDDG